MFKKAFKFILTFLIFSLLSPPLFAEKDVDRGLSQSELVSLREIDQLIKETRYDEALSKLNLYIEETPESFDSAQLRIQKIMNLREEYARIYDKVHELLLTDPENDEKLEYYTGQLRKIEKQKDTPLGLFIDEIYATARFRINYAKMDHIMNDTQAHLARKDYNGPAKIIEEGFVLYLDDFTDEWNTGEHKDSIYDPAMYEKTHLEFLLEQWASYIDRFKKASENFIQAVNLENNDDIQTAFTELKGAAEEFSTYRTEIYRCAQVFTDLFQLCKDERKKDGIELTDASFLPFIRYFILGRTHQTDTGLMGVMNTLWEDSMTSMKEILQVKVDNYMLAFQKAMPNKLFEQDFDPFLSYSIVEEVAKWQKLAADTTALSNL